MGTTSEREGRMLEYFLFGMFLGALFAVAFYLGWRMGIDNYLKRAREHVKKYGNEYKKFSCRER